MSTPAQAPDAARPGAAAASAMLWLALALPAVAASSADPTSLSLEQLLEVTIVGASKYEQRQSEVAAAVSVITRQEIRAFGWRTLGEALASLPGVHTTYDRQYQYLGMRGFGLPGDLTARVLINIDGNRLNDPVYDGGPVGRELPIDMDLIERIEFIPGPGGAVYGQNAMFGVVNVITRTGADVGGTELAAGAQRPQGLSEGRATWGRVLDNGIDVLLSVSGMRARGQDRYFEYGASGVAGVAAGLDGERDQRFIARVAGGPWTFEFIDGDRRKDDPTGTYRTDPLVPGQYARDRYTLAQLQYQDSFADGTLRASGRLFVGRYLFRSILSYGTPVSFPAQADWRGAEWHLVSTAVAGHKLMAGLEVQDNLRIDQAALDAADPSRDIRIATPGHRIGVYAQDEWRIGETLTATAGVRVDRDDITGSQTSPRAALIWQATADTMMKALYGRAHRAPNAYERAYDDGFSQVANPALRGESIDTFEWVVDHRVSHDLTVRGSVYQWTSRGLITLGIDAATGVPQYQSGETIRARGLELSADKTWASGARLRGSVSLQDRAHTGAAALLNSPNALGKLNFSSPLPLAGLRLGYELQYDSSRLSQDGTRTGGYAISNLRLGTEALAPGMEVSVSIHNLLDRRYAHPASESAWQNAIEQDGRSIGVKLSQKF